MGPGRKPRKERNRPAATAGRAGGRFNGAWAKTQEGTLGGKSAMVELLRLQWGLGENPGRNQGVAPPPDAVVQRFNGAWAKTQEGTRRRRGQPPRRW